MVRAFAIVDRVLTLALLVPTLIFTLIGVVGTLTHEPADHVDLGAIFIFLLVAGGLVLRFVATLKYEKHPWFTTSAMLFTAPAVFCALSVVDMLGYRGGFSDTDVFVNVLGFAYLVTSVGALVCLIVHGWIWLFRPLECNLFCGHTS